MSMVIGREANSVIYGNTSMAESITSARNVVCMAKHVDNSATLEGFNTTGRYGCFFMADGMPWTESVSLISEIRALYTSLTGIALP